MAQTLRHIYTEGPERCPTCADCDAALQATAAEYSIEIIIKY